ncbi:hypothetical protein ACWDFH_28420, partial [Streptomyces kronopolitis]
PVFPIAVDVASHCPLVDPVLPALRLQSGRPATPRLCVRPAALYRFRPQISSLTTLSSHLPARCGPLVAVC